MRCDVVALAGLILLVHSCLYLDADRGLACMRLEGGDARAEMRVRNEGVEMSVRDRRVGESDVGLVDWWVESQRSVVLAEAGNGATMMSGEGEKKALRLVVVTRM